MPTATPHVADTPSISSEGAEDGWPVGGRVDAEEGDGEECGDGVEEFEIVVELECCCPG